MKESTDGQRLPAGENAEGGAEISGRQKGVILDELSGGGTEVTGEVRNFVARRIYYDRGESDALAERLAAAGTLTRKEADDWNDAHDWKEFMRYVSDDVRKMTKDVLREYLVMYTEIGSDGSTPESVGEELAAVIGDSGTRQNFIRQMEERHGIRIPLVLTEGERAARPKPVKEYVTTDRIAGYMESVLSGAGFETETSGSGLSDSRYITVTNWKDVTGSESGHNGNELKIRISSHDLPPSYDGAHGYHDIDVRSGGVIRHGNDGGAVPYYAALEEIFREAGKKLPARAERLLERKARESRERQADRERAASEREAAARERRAARESLYDRALKSDDPRIKDEMSLIRDLNARLDKKGEYGQNAVTGDRRRKMKKRVSEHEKTVGSLLATEYKERQGGNMTNESKTTAGNENENPNPSGETSRKYPTNLHKFSVNYDKIILDRETGKITMSLEWMSDREMSLFRQNGFSVEERENHWEEKDLPPGDIDLMPEDIPPQMSYVCTAELNPDTAAFAETVRRELHEAAREKEIFEMTEEYPASEALCRDGWMWTHWGDRSGGLHNGRREELRVGYEGDEMQVTDTKNAGNGDLLYTADGEWSLDEFKAKAERIVENYYGLGREPKNTLTQNINKNEENKMTQNIDENGPDNDIKADGKHFVKIDMMDTECLARALGEAGVPDAAALAEAAAGIFETCDYDLVYDTAQRNFILTDRQSDDNVFRYRNPTAVVHTAFDCINVRRDVLGEDGEDAETEHRVELLEQFVKTDIANLEIISDKDFSNIIDTAYHDDYKPIPAIVRLPGLTPELSKKIGLDGNTRFIIETNNFTREQASSFSDEEYKAIPKILREATFAVISKGHNTQTQIVFDDKNNNKKINSLMITSDSRFNDDMINCFVRPYKTDRENIFQEKDFEIVGVGVTPTMSSLREGPPAARLQPSPAADENINRDTQENDLFASLRTVIRAYANDDKKSVEELDDFDDGENGTARDARKGHWKMSDGGYDRAWQIYYTDDDGNTTEIASAAKTPFGGEEVTLSNKRSYCLKDAGLNQYKALAVIREEYNRNGAREAVFREIDKPSREMHRRQITANIQGLAGFTGDTDESGRPVYSDEHDGTAPNLERDMAEIMRASPDTADAAEEVAAAIADSLVEEYDYEKGMWTSRDLAAKEITEALDDNNVSAEGHEGLAEALTDCVEEFKKNHSYEKFVREMTPEINYEVLGDEHSVTIRDTGSGETKSFFGASFNDGAKKFMENYRNGNITDEEIEKIMYGEDEETAKKEQYRRDSADHEENAPRPDAAKLTEKPVIIFDANPYDDETQNILDAVRKAEADSGLPPRRTELTGVMSRSHQNTYETMRDKTSVAIIKHPSWDDSDFTWYDSNIVDSEPWMVDSEPWRIEYDENNKVKEACNLSPYHPYSRDVGAVIRRGAEELIHDGTAADDLFDIHDPEQLPFIIRQIDSGKNLTAFACDRAEMPFFVLYNEKADETLQKAMDLVRSIRSKGGIRSKGEYGQLYYDQSYECASVLLRAATDDFVEKKLGRGRDLGVMWDEYAASNREIGELLPATLKIFHDSIVEDPDDKEYRSWFSEDSGRALVEFIRNTAHSETVGIDERDFTRKIPFSAIADDVNRTMNRGPLEILRDYDRYLTEHYDLVGQVPPDMREKVNRVYDEWKSFRFPDDEEVRAVRDKWYTGENPHTPSRAGLRSDKANDTRIDRENEIKETENWLGEHFPQLRSDKVNDTCIGWEDEIEDWLGKYFRREGEYFNGSKTSGKYSYTLDPAGAERITESDLAMFKNEDRPPEVILAEIKDSKFDEIYDSEMEGIVSDLQEYMRQTYDASLSRDDIQDYLFDNEKLQLLQPSDERWLALEREGTKAKLVKAGIRLDENLDENRETYYYARQIPPEKQRYDDLDEDLRNDEVTILDTGSGRAGNIINANFPAGTFEKFSGKMASLDRDVYSIYARESDNPSLKTALNEEFPKKDGGGYTDTEVQEWRKVFEKYRSEGSLHYTSFSYDNAAREVAADVIRLQTGRSYSAAHITGSVQGEDALALIPDEYASWEYLKDLQAKFWNTGTQWLVAESDRPLRPEDINAANESIETAEYYVPSQNTDTILRKEIGCGYGKLIMYVDPSDWANNATIVEDEHGTFATYTEEQAEILTGLLDGQRHTAAADYVLEKLRAAGIEVVTDKDEFGRILRSAENAENQPKIQLMRRSGPTEKDYAEHLNETFAENYGREELAERFSYMTVKGREGGNVTQRTLEKYIDESRCGELLRKYDATQFNTGYSEWAGRQDTQIEYMKTARVSDNNVYGFTFGGKIYLDPDLMNSNTPVHEYTHLWDAYTRRENPGLWEQGKEVFRQTHLWGEVRNDPNYADIADDDDMILSECHARVCGIIAEKVLEQIAERDGGIARDRVIDWDKAAAEYVAEELHVRPELGSENFAADAVRAEYLRQFLAMPVKDLMSGKAITAEKEMAEERKESPAYMKKKADGLKDPPHLNLEKFFSGTDGLAAFREALQKGDDIQSAMMDAIDSAIGGPDRDLYDEEEINAGYGNWLYGTAEQALGGMYKNIKEIQKENDELTKEDRKRKEEERKERKEEERIGEMSLKFREKYKEITPENFKQAFKDASRIKTFRDNPTYAAAFCIDRAHGDKNRREIADWLKKQGCTSREASDRIFAKWQKESSPKRAASKSKEYDASMEM